MVKILADKTLIVKIRLMASADPILSLSSQYIFQQATLKQFVHIYVSFQTLKIIQFHFRSRLYKKKDKKMSAMTNISLQYFGDKIKGVNFVKVLHVVFLSF